VLNKAILIGRTGREPVIRRTSNGHIVASFTLATDESFKDSKGERQTHTEWHGVVAWGTLAEIVEQYLKKGALCYVEGSIRQSEYEKDGEKKRSFEINAHALQILSDRDGSGSASRKPEQEQTGEEVPEFLR
jgi:single-strand DNA-binding protein